MVIMHFDLIRFERQYHWLQGIGAVRSINQNEAGSAAGMSLEHTMTVEVLAADDGPAPAGPEPDGAKKPADPADPPVHPERDSSAVGPIPSPLCTAGHRRAALAR